MSPSTVHHIFLKTFVCAHGSDGFMENDGDRMLGSCMNLQRSARLDLVEVRELKDQGNGFFRQNDFDMAAKRDVDLITSLKTNEHNSNKHVLEFSKKGGGSSRLRIPTDSYKKLLLEGKTVSFYRKQDLSTLTIRILKDDDNKERDFIREHYKEKKRKKRRCPKKRKSKVMEDMTSLETTYVNPAIYSVSSSASLPGAVSSSASSICDNSLYDNSSSPSTHIPQDNTKGVIDESSSPVSLVVEKASSFCFPDHIDSKIHQPFLFSARPKICKIYSLEKSSCDQLTHMFSRYSPTHQVRKKWRMVTLKKNHSQGDESPRHNLSTFSKSRSLSHKFLRPRGVSVSCCRYSPKAQIPKKRKDMASLTYYSSIFLKKPRV